MNMQEKFVQWQERMQKKSDQDKHNYAITITVIIVGIITFFVVSSWYYTFFGYVPVEGETGIFGEVEKIFVELKKIW